jgi:hypothetical protein
LVPETAGRHSSFGRFETPGAGQLKTTFTRWT